MGGRDAITTAALDERVVLLAVAKAAADGTTPANPADVRAICNECLARDDGPVFGRLSEADVARALYRLEESDLVENEGPPDTSPTGKGRPLYVPGPDVSEIHETLADDDDLGPLLAELT